MTYKRKKHLPTIRKMPDDLWDKIKIILPPEKPDKTIGRPIVPFRKILESILYVLRTGCQWKMCLRSMVLVLLHVIIDDFRNEQCLKYFRNCGLGCWKHTSFLDTKIKSFEEDPDKKCIITWNDYLGRIKYFMRWPHNYRRK